MAKKKSASSQREKRLPANALLTVPITDRERQALRRLAKMPDAQIDFSDAPESGLTGGVEVGHFYRPIKTT